MKNFFTRLRDEYGGQLDIRLLLLGAAGLILILLGNFYDEPEQQPAPTAIQAERGGDYSSEELALENKLAAILAKIKGAGRVDISVSLSGSTIKRYEKNVVKEVRVTEEKGAQGIIRTTNETKENLQIMTNRDRGEEQPVVITEEKPTVCGIIIVADGAGDSAVKENLLRAAEAGLNVSANKITVLPRGR